MTEHTPELRVRAMLQGGRVSLADFFVCGKSVINTCCVTDVSSLTLHAACH